MKTSKYTLVLIALLLALGACKRENPGDNTDDNKNINGTANVAAKDLVVPANFNFETEKELNVRVAVANVKAGERYVIKIYTNIPSTNDLISTGITDAKGEYTTKLRVPASEDFIYIEKVNPDGSSYFEKVKANTFVATVMNDPIANPYIIRKSGSGMTCNTGCTRTVNNLTSNDIALNNETVCYTGTLNGSITVRSGGKAKICGSGTISGLTIEGTGEVYLLEGTILSIGNLNCNSTDVILKSWSDSVTTSGSISVNGDVRNYGKLYVNGDFNINGGEFRNEGNLNVTSNFNANKKFKNYHYTTVNGSFNNNGGGEVKNYCFLWVKQNFNNNNTLWNNCFIKVGQTFTLNGGGYTELDNGGIVYTKDATLNNEIKGTGTNRSKVKVSANTTINGGGKVSGKIDFCDSNGVENNWGTISSPAALSCTGYIAASTCFPDGFGQPTIQDADNDGVPDAQDEYPNDATRAFNSYYPNANSTATLAFEDLWPSQGDFDFNDLVLAFNIQKVLNADNKVVDYKVKMKVRAIGASYDNGFGFRLDELVSADVNSVNGQILVRSLITNNANGTEAGQDRAVIICYDSPEPSMQRAAGSMFNTIKTNGVGTSDTIRVNVNFTTPVLDSKLGIEKFNPFIFTNRRRGYEIHLGNFKPTTLADSQLFGTQQDRTNVGNSIYYKTSNGMPWAILIPEDFVYPTERTPITDAYNLFDDWSLSSGSNFTNWYTNAPGNRNSSSTY